MSIESQLYRIIEGKIAYEGSYIYDPFFAIRKAGNKIYEECLEFIDDDIFDDRQAKILLAEQDIWSGEKEKRFKDLPRIIENQKIEYFKNFDSPIERKQHKNLLEMRLTELSSLSKIRNRYHHLTPEGIASMVMWVTMIDLMYKGENKVGALTYYHRSAISEQEVREIAMSNEWSNYSNLSKTPFRKSPIRMTEYQRRLLSWTNIYKNVRTHTDFPGPKVMEDHDAFDGWLIQLGRKEQMSKAKTVFSSKMKPNTRNAFFMGKANQEEVEEIESMNV